MRSSVDTLVIEQRPSTDWWHDAECRHYAQHVNFFPTHGESAREAKQICGMCDVRSQCLEYAMRFEPLCGVWGGLTERERRELRRDREGRRRRV